LEKVTTQPWNNGATTWTFIAPHDPPYAIPEKDHTMNRGLRVLKLAINKREL
jgi:hypothetical protein